MIKNFVKKHDLPKYRVDQFNKSFYQDAVSSFDEITTWPKDLRENLKKEVEFSSLGVEEELVSKSKDTIKIAFKRKKSGQVIEICVNALQKGQKYYLRELYGWMPYGLWICATGKMGFQGNLSAEEIIDQIMHFKRILKKENKEITNIVFMGMGEPLLNLDEVQKAIAIINDPEKLALGVRRVTVSTCGITDKLEELINSGFKGKLAISLHAPNQALREQIMPAAKKYPLNKLFKVLDQFTEKTNKKITYEYILIKDLNDKPEQAKELAGLLKNKLAQVNLIRYNQVPEIDFQSFETRQGQGIFRNPDKKWNNQYNSCLNGPGCKMQPADNWHQNQNG